MRRRARGGLAAARVGVWVAGLFAVVAAGVLGGCGLTVRGPVASTRAAGGATGGAQARVARANLTHEYTANRPPPERASGGEVTPAEAIRAFAELYMNWTPRTVVGNLRALAGASLGQARAAMQLAAAQTARDYELRRGGIANRGTVAAVAPLAGGRNRFVVVTQEQTTASASNAYQGLQPAWHITVATVTPVAPGVWVVSGWEPEN